MIGVMDGKYSRSYASNLLNWNHSFTLTGSYFLRMTPSITVLDKLLGGLKILFIKLFLIKLLKQDMEEINDDYIFKTVLY